MKKQAILWLTLLLVFCAGMALAQVEPRGYVKGQGYQYFTIGTYPQTTDGQVEPLLWRALTVENGQALMLTEYVIDAQQVIFETNEEIIAKHAYRRIGSFEESDLCGWMNTVMLEKIMGDTGLGKTLVTGEFGKLYPLTDDQLLMPEYGFSTARFGAVPVRCGKVTEYAKTVGVYGDANNAAPYWVAAVKAADGYKMQIVGFNGHLSYGAYTRTNIGIRPAMMIDLNLCDIVGGEGSKQSPIQIVLRKQADATKAANATETSTIEGTASSTVQPMPTVPSSTAVIQSAVSASNSETNASVLKTQPMTEGSLALATTPTPKAEEQTAAAMATQATMSTGDTNQTAKLSLVGDCSIGDAYQFRNVSDSLTSVIAKNGTAWPFSLVSACLLTDDITAANLEVCLTNSDSAVDKMFPLIALPKNVAVLKQGGIDIVNTVNNHCFDFGTQGYHDTLATLDSAGIQHFGSAVMSGGLASDIIATVEAKGIRFGFLGFSYPQTSTLELIKQRIQALRDDGCDVVIVSLHWGRETYMTPNIGQTQYAAKVIDMGADVVWGHHPHVLQPVQFYKGKLVLFSTGNFIFGTMSDVEPSTGIFQLEYQKTAQGVMLCRFSVIPCITQGSGDYRPYVLSDKTARQKVWNYLRKHKAYSGYDNLPETFLTTGVVDFDDNGQIKDNQ